MRVYWHYSCDFGHDWVVERGDDRAPDVSEKICAEGHSAILESRYPAVDQAEIRLRPAGRIVNPRRREGHQCLYENKYYIVLSSIAGGDEVVSQNVYDWRAAIGLIERFRGRPVKECVERMKKFEESGSARQRWTKSGEEESPRKVVAVDGDGDE